VARTWVNVRSDASLEGEVVGVVRPDSRALLGAERRGWRRITLDGVSGWVDPRLFASASAGS
jgi:SH3-like domain-containing protein